VLSRRLETPFDGDPFRLYRALRTINPSPYMFFLEFPELAIVGASPEMLLRVEGGAAQLAPIAGTRPRGADADADAALEADLLADAKERAEHVMLVDLGRNDLGRVCRAGSVHVPRFMQVERYSHVMHLVSSVTGRLAEGVDALDALAACFPAGTLSGAPKVRAMEIIEELETVRRGMYGGAIGYAGFGGRSLDTCIAIRTVVIRDGTAHLQVGAGIVADSDPHRELEETNSKARAMLAALAMAGTGAGSAGTTPRTAELPA
jgi:anthranilate synthase component I